ncbi:tyrosine-type recombinase/integrase [Secundilactobacillus kimchicus]|uniref:tyrosine-type recombinase/integrase n=1 Tax=Secundilactobacillus kimchicus TaxID=528209 RepID=UPI001C0252DD|nr:tyrosine-type recombinase/integrase [Secundilactobacillus kimchicus]
MASIKKKNGKWAVRISYTDTHGKRKFVNKAGFKTKTEAEKFVSATEIKINSGFAESTGKTLLVDYFDDWVATYKNGMVRSRTMGRYNTAAKLLKQYLSGVYLQKITRMQYQQFITKAIHDHHYSHTSIEAYHSVIRSAVKFAIDDGIVTRDFTSRVTIAGHDSKPDSQKFLELDELSKLYNATMEFKGLDSIYRSIIFTAINTGMRVAEILGLTWSSVNWKFKSIEINKTWYNKGFHKTKNQSSVRTIAIDDTLLNHLKEIHKVQLAAGLNNPNQLVFMGARDKMPFPAPLNRRLHEMCVQLGIKQITMHGLRHSHVSFLIHENVTLAYIAKRLGHRNTLITRKVYSHMLEVDNSAYDSIAMQALSQLGSAQKVHRS